MGAGFLGTHLISDPEPGFFFHPAGHRVIVGVDGGEIISFCFFSTKGGAPSAVDPKAEIKQMETKRTIKVFSEFIFSSYFNCVKKILCHFISSALT